MPGGCGPTRETLASSTPAPSSRLQVVRPLDG